MGRSTDHPVDVNLVHQIAAGVSIHTTAVVDEPVVIGERTRIWHFVHVSSGAKIGQECVLGQNVYIGPDVQVADRVKIQNNVSVYSGVTLEDDVFVGPSVVFTNVKTPRSHVDRSDSFMPTCVQQGATIGANATILCGVTVGRHALIGAGSVVTRDVPAYAQVLGNPARLVGWVDKDGACCDVPTDELGTHERPVRMLDPAAENASFQEELDHIARDVLRSGSFILGQRVDAFERACQEYLGVEHAIGVSSGSDALLLALTAAGVGAGDEVITTPFSFVSGVEAILRLGAVPTFVDIDPVTHLIDSARVMAAVTDRTKAFLPVHLFGQAVDLSLLSDALASADISVVEDAAQAWGTTSIDGKRLGNSGNLTCFSFFPSKNLGGFGDGGLITTSDAQLAARLRCLRAHGAITKYQYLELGGNHRLDALQAALLTIKLKHIDRLLDRRRALAHRYQSCLLGLAVQKLRLPTLHKSHSFNQYVIECDRRDALRAHLQNKGIETAIYYPQPLHIQPVLGQNCGKMGDFPRSEQACLHVLALPLHPSLTHSDIDRVCREVGEFFRAEA